MTRGRPKSAVSTRTGEVCVMNDFPTKLDRYVSLRRCAALARDDQQWRLAADCDEMANELFETLDFQEQTHALCGDY